MNEHYDLCSSRTAQVCHSRLYLAVGR